MTSPQAPATTATHRIAVLVLDHALPLEISMPFVVFGAPHLPYDIFLCGQETGPLATDHGWPITIENGLDALATADTVIIPAYRDFLTPIPDTVTDALRTAHTRGARIASICTGAFALAAAGLLDGKRATTHWYYADELARRCPTAQIDPDVLYVDSDDILTSAGVVSGIDLCLHLLRTDHGAAVANDIARNIVAAPHRDGGQAQFIRLPARPVASTDLGATQEWALRHLADPLTVAELASHAHLPLRTFERRFVAETGTTPMKWLNAARVDRARELLETTDAAVDYIGHQCGLGTAANFRHHFRNITGTTPREYRRRFASR